MAGENQKASPSESSGDLGSEDSASTTSDEDVVIGRGKSKRQRKHYQPSEDALFEMEQDSDSAINLDTSEESIPEKQATKATSKRRKSVDGQQRAQRYGPAEEYDEDEAALQHALALSLANTHEADATSPLAQQNSSQRVPVDESRRKYDPEEDALQQALAASMTDAEGVLDGMRVSDADGREAQNAAKSTVASPSSLKTSPAKESKPIAIDGRDSAGQGAAKNKARKKVTKPAFEQPSITMVQQAFTMLDPPGRGRVSALALQQVASKLLHKELNRDQLDAMMEFAHSMASKDEGSIPGVLDAEGFSRLVARFADPPAE